MNANTKKALFHTHYSDLARLQLLSEYGGTWADSTVYCTGRKFENLMHLPLFAFRDTLFSSNAGLWFISSYDHNPIITLTRDLMFAYWRDFDYLWHYFMINMFFKTAAEAYSEEWEKVPYMLYHPACEMHRSFYDDYSEEKMKHFAEASDFHKLTYKFNPEKKKPSSILQHIIDSYK